MSVLHERVRVKKIAFAVFFLAAFLVLSFSRFPPSSRKEPGDLWSQIQIAFDLPQPRFNQCLPGIIFHLVCIIVGAIVLGWMLAALLAASRHLIMNGNR